MDKGFKNRNFLVIVFEILVIALGVGGITYATSKLLNDRTTTIITAGEYNLDYVGDKEVTFNEIEPISDSLINIDTKENVIRTEFSVRGVSSNKKDNLIYDVMLSDMSIDCSLLSKYLKWNLYKNGSLIANGSLDPVFDGNVLSDNMRLTNIQEDLPKYNQEYDHYVLLFWISEACEDLTTCNLVDQSNMLNSKMKMKVFIALYSGAKKAYERVPNYDTSCANKPEMYDNMVAVTYKSGEWVVADETNSDKDNYWYDYSNQIWANAVVVKDSSKYQKVGTSIDENDVMGYFVWIPRYKYKLWNAMDEVSDSYNAYDNGIDIVFENGLNKTSDKIENGYYLTHPAFGDDLRGFWISKYEISKANNNYRFVRNVESYRQDTLDNYKNITVSLSNEYKLGNDVESHMVTNLEWGSTLYLSHSKYGVCKHDGCDTIGINDTYLSGNNKQDTTTRNIYGVYDMAGASGEYVLGSSSLGTATKEVFLANNDTWYQGMALLSERDYIIRGGINKSLFYFGNMTMDSTENSTRTSLISKKVSE